MPTPDPIPVIPGRQDMVDIYAEALARLKSVIAGEDFTAAAKRIAAEKIIDIQRHIKELQKTQAAWAEKYIPEAYKYGAFQDEKILKRYLTNESNMKYGKVHREAAMVAAEGVAQDFRVVADALERTFVGYVRRAQVIGAQRQIARDIAGGIVEGATRRTVSNRLLETLKSQALAGQITVGKVTMNAKAYADLLARTVSRAARTEGTLNRLTENGLDLVICSNTGAVDFCTQYEDQIFSISGRSSRFPMLVARPPYHPNCTHTLSAWIEDFAAPGEVEQGSQFDIADLNKTSQEMAKKYPIIADDDRARTKNTQKAA